MRYGKRPAFFILQGVWEIQINDKIPIKKLLINHNEKALQFGGPFSLYLRQCPCYFSLSFSEAFRFAIRYEHEANKSRRIKSGERAPLKVICRCYNPKSCFFFTSNSS